jgi:multidrug resistance efflux pump
MIYINCRFSCFQLFLFLILLLHGNINILAQENKLEIKITSPVSGVIKKVYVQTGQIIKHGDLLLEFDDTLILSNLSEAHAKMNLAIINRSEAKKELERAEELYERTVLSEHELQQSKISYSDSMAQYASAQNLMVHAQWEKKHSKLYAPFHSQILNVSSYAGQYVNNKLTAQTLFIIKRK